ncbi:hypothetical protein HJG60_009165 [Phyllostomus discolor]|uniref:Uncharacterized protein n=1 Tax=Phyllostomus discolor TaxID=89673 RepID=A0A833YM89_9CHIR|nr:hypothetical protein HJG60_009165 [Phyllostomus discolor]
MERPQCRPAGGEGELPGGLGKRQHRGESKGQRVKGSPLPADCSSGASRLTEARGGALSAWWPSYLPMSPRAGSGRDLHPSGLAWRGRGLAAGAPQNLPSPKAAFRRGESQVEPAQLFKPCARSRRASCSCFLGSLLLLESSFSASSPQCFQTTTLRCP